MTITAERGRIDGDRAHGEFSGNVVVTRDADPTPSKDGPNGPVTLRTESLKVATKEQRVSTDRAVTIEEPRGIIRGQGLEFDNKAKVVRIRSRVNGTFQPREAGK